jgi:hypothetical protein
MTAPPDGSILEGALTLARGGIPVISLRPRSKIPLHAGWPELGMLDHRTIELEWQLNPEANVGVLCGPDGLDGDGLTVVDVDVPDGLPTLQRMERDYGYMPVTTMVDTPSGGMHYYLRGCTPSWNPGPGLEVRSAGRQCVAPPSVHPTGGRYMWRRDRGIEPLPAWLVKTSVSAEPRASFTPSGLRDPVLEVPPPMYFRELTGLVPDRDGFVCCPIHGEAEASLKVYDTADRGWFCYGESCRRGGDAVTLVAELAGVPTPVRGYQFVALLDYLRGRLL